MTVFAEPEFTAHERVVFATDRFAGLRAIVAIHDTTRGPALGGCRMWPYANEAAALRDALRLSRGMSYKAALAGLPLGGGKSVVIGNPRSDKSAAMWRAMGRAVDDLSGRYICAEDVGTTVRDMAVIREATRYVVGLAPDQGGYGDPSPFTAYGVFVGIQAAVEFQLGYRRLDGIRVAVQGLGNVGFDLCRRLAEAGARLLVDDLREDMVRRAVEAFDATPMSGDALIAADAEVFAPCALGGVLNDDTIPRLRARIVAGAANNQLAESRHGESLRRRGILYAPDYIVNAGGLICVAAEYFNAPSDGVARQVESIHDTLYEVFQRADRLGLPSDRVADRMAEERLRNRPAGAFAA